MRKRFPERLSSLARPRQNRKPFFLPIQNYPFKRSLACTENVHLCGIKSFSVNPLEAASEHPTPCCCLLAIDGLASRVETIGVMMPCRRFCGEKAGRSGYSAPAVRTPLVPTHLDKRACFGWPVFIWPGNLGLDAFAACWHLTNPPDLAHPVFTVLNTPRKSGFPPRQRGFFAPVPRRSTGGCVSP